MAIIGKMMSENWIAVECHGVKEDMECQDDIESGDEHKCEAAYKDLAKIMEEQRLA